MTSGRDLQVAEERAWAAEAEAHRAMRAACYRGAPEAEWRAAFAAWLRSRAEWSRASDALTGALPAVVVAAAATAGFGSLAERDRAAGRPPRYSFDDCRIGE